MASTTTSEDLKSLYAAFNLYSNWDRMSGAQKSKAIVSLGMQGYKFTSGNDFAKQWLIEPNATGQGLTYGQAFGLFGAGVNVYSLAKNWQQLSTIQKLSGGTKFALDVAQTAKSFNLLGYGTNGAAVPAASTAQLGSAWAATPAQGVGAVSAPTGTAIPQGYVAVPSSVPGQVTAVPAANAPSAGGAASGGTPIASMGTPSYAGYAAAAFEVYNTFANNKNVRDNDQATYHQKHAGLAVADVWTAGGASAAYGLLMNTGFGRKLDKLYDKIDKKFNPVTRIAGGLLNSDKWKTEGNRLAQLREKGVFVPDEMFANPQTRGITKKELVARAEASGGNVEFAKTRDEKTLTPDDVVGYAAWAEKDPDWFKKSLDEQRTIAAKALEQGLIREHDGTIDIEDTEAVTPEIVPDKSIQSQRKLNGSQGGSQMQAGLAKMAKTDPYLAGAVIAHSAYSGSYKNGDGKAALKMMKQDGIFDHEKLTLPNGTILDVHGQKDTTDTNNDLHYYAGLAGITLAELVAQGKHSGVSKAGQQLGNSLLTGISNADLTPENFAAVRDNMRAVYSQAGIKSRADAYQRANVLYAGERIDDMDLVRMHQVADMTFGDNGHEILSKLTPGKTRGLQVAQEDAGMPLITGPSDAVQPKGDIDPGRMPNAQPVQSNNFIDNALYSSKKRPMRSKEEMVMQNSQKYGNFNAELG